MSLNIKTDNGHQQLASLGGNVINGAEMQHYSTEERMVGYWIDGKPIYRKVVSISLTAADFTYDISNLNVDIPINIRGYIVLNNNAHNSIPVNYASDNPNYGVGTWFTKTAIRFVIGSNYINLPYSGKVVLEYTKTTDIPITNNNTYSTDEVLTGKTWIDGKPIYRKVFTGKFGAHQVYSSNIRYNRAMLNLQFADIVTVGGYINTYRTDEGTSAIYKLLINSTALSWTTDGAVDKSCYCTVEPNGICLNFDTKYNSVWRSDNMDYVVIVEYTKTN